MEVVQEKYNRWWNNQNERPILYFTSTENYISNYHLTRNSWDFTSESNVKDQNTEKFWFDDELRINSFLEGVKHTSYFKDSYPYFWVDYGPGILAGCIGVGLEFDFNTMWIPQSLEKYENLEEKLTIDRDNYYWRKLHKTTRKALDRSEGRYITSITDIGGVMDVLAGIRGSNQFLKDLIRKPQKVKTAMEYLFDSWFELFNSLTELLLDAQEAAVAWNGIYSELPTYTIQNDLSAMISPEMFNEFDMPYKEKLTERIPNTIYHLDGPDALKHLDSILSLSNLNAVQWVPGAGQPGGNTTAGGSSDGYWVNTGMLEWVDTLKKIKEAGKSLELWVHPQDVLPLIQSLGPERLLLKVESVPSKSECKKVISQLVSEGLIDH